MRQLIQMGNARPLIGRYRVFHLDEVQKLSESAKSVLLKFVEEPPKFTVIILSTMEPEKFYGDKPGAAMKSRVTEVLLPHPTNEEVAEHLAKIVKAEKVEVANSVLAIIADYADGIMRNAIKILDVVIDSGEEILKDKSLATAVIAKAAGKSPYEASKCALLALYNSNVGGLLEAIASFDNHNFMLKVMIEQNTDVIRYRVNPKYVKQGGPTFSARDLARSAITTNAVAKLGMRLQEIQHRAASYAINVDHALVNLVASSTSA
jgi:DNA polymerase III gamma/tau subunit